MSIQAAIRLFVRQRATFRCEYCGVSETDAGGELTIDHFQPRSKGGSNDSENLLYCCHRCNECKGDYWPTATGESSLLNPRRDSFSDHLVSLPDGMLLAVTKGGVFTVSRIRLNRPSLVEYRLRKHIETNERRLLERYREVVVVLDNLRQQQAELLEKQRILLKEQLKLLEFLLRKSK